MKAKDTILSPEKQKKIFNKYPCLDNLVGLETKVSLLLEKQADASFKAGYHQRELDPLDKEDRCEKCYTQGIKEVVDWVERWALVGLLEKTQEKWRRQKKEWRIE